MTDKFRLNVEADDPKFGPAAISEFLSGTL